jgi:heat shock protein HslJ
MREEDYVGAIFASTSQGEPFLEFAEDGSYTGSDGCNRLNGTYEAADDELVLKPGLTTLMACPDVDTWVRDAKSVKVDSDTLVVFDKSGSEIGTLTRS